MPTTETFVKLCSVVIHALVGGINKSCKRKPAGLCKIGTDSSRLNQERGRAWEQGGLQTVVSVKHVILQRELPNSEGPLSLEVLDPFGYGMNEFDVCWPICSRI